MSKKLYVGRTYKVKDDVDKIPCHQNPQTGGRPRDRSIFGEVVIVTDETKKLVQTFSTEGEQTWFSKHFLDGPVTNSKTEDNPCKVLNKTIDSLAFIGQEYPNLGKRLKDIVEELQSINTELEKSF